MYQEEYKRWMTADLEDADLMPELAKIEGNDDEIKERFAVALKFGTAGLRGVLGAGTNRMNIYVGNMPYSMTETDLNSAFSAHGSVSSARLVTDRDTGRAKGFGFVEMNDANEAKAAIEALNGTSHDGRELVVNEARPREERPNRNGGGNRGFGGGRRSW